MNPNVTFFDIPQKKGNIPWSLNMWKTRYTLHLKGIEYETRWVEYPDVASVCQEHGIPPLRVKEDGITPHYTCPAIIDQSTGAAVVDSIVIAAYLERTYPDTPKVFPDGSHALHIAFSEIHDQKFLPGWPIISPAVGKILNPRSEEYFFRTRSQRFGKPLNELIKSEEERADVMKLFKTSFWDVMDYWYSKTDGPFFMGDKISYADFIIASDVNFLASVWGEDSINWKEFVAWHGGKWVQLRDEVDRRCRVSH